MQAPAFPVYARLLKSGGFPAHSSHRGGAEQFGPENTMYNFRKCVWECSTQVLETDLTLTRDGVLILLHDSEVDRTTNGRGKSRSMTLAEIKQLDAGFHYPHLRGQGIQIPTFEEFLDEFIPYEDLVFFLDFKETDAVLKTMEVVKARGIENRVLLGSVSQDANQLLSTLRLPTMPLITDAPTTISIVMAFMSGMGFSLEIKHDIVGYILSPQTRMFWKKDLVDAIHGKGKKVLVSGVDATEDQKQCIQWGVDFILSDRPDILAKTMGRDLDSAKLS